MVGSPLGLCLCNGVGVLFSLAGTSGPWQGKSALFWVCVLTSQHVRSCSNGSPTLNLLLLLLLLLLPLIQTLLTLCSLLSVPFGELASFYL